MSTRAAGGLVLSLSAFSLWLAALFAGLVGHGLIHLLVFAALSGIPWRRIGVSIVWRER